LCLGVAVRPPVHSEGPARRRITSSRFARGAVIAAVISIGLVGTGGTAAAHDIAPSSSTPARIGPYALDVRFYAGPVGGRELPFELVPSDNAPAPTRFAVTAVPGPGTDAVPVRARVAAAMGHAGQTGLVNLPGRGRWLLEIEVDGPTRSRGGQCTGRCCTAGSGDARMACLGDRDSSAVVPSRIRRHPPLASRGSRRQRRYCAESVIST